MACLLQKNHAFILLLFFCLDSARNIGGHYVSVNFGKRHVQGTKHFLIFFKAYGTLVVDFFQQDFNAHFYCFWHSFSHIITFAFFLRFFLKWASAKRFSQGFLLSKKSFPQKNAFFKSSIFPLLRHLEKSAGYSMAKPFVQTLFLPFHTLSSHALPLPMAAHPRTIAMPLQTII
jgi:hypothetical protein